MFQIIFLFGASVLTNVAAQILLKRGMLLVFKPELNSLNFLKLIPQIFQNVFLLLGLVVFGISFFLWLLILSRLSLNIAYPIVTSLNFSLVTIASWVLFKEELSAFQILGIGVIVLGIFLLIKH